MNDSFQPLILIVSGPSGSGKSTVVEYLLEEIPTTMFSVSHTTRQPRGQEQDGRDYFFVSTEEFEAMKDGGEFLESDYHFGHWYGTHRSNLDRAREARRDLLLDVDVIGARQIKEQMPDAVAILFVPPSREELEKRLRHRGQDDEEVIHKRLERAREELLSYQGYDYVVVNDDLARAREQVRAIVCSERARLGRQAPDCGPFGRPPRELAAAASRENNNQRVSAILDSFAPGAAQPPGDSGAGRDDIRG